MRDDVQCPSIHWTFLIKINATQSCNYDKMHTVEEPFFYFNNEWAMGVSCLIAESNLQNFNLFFSLITVSNSK